MLLAIYLNDHLAGATAGRELARRAASHNRKSSYGLLLEQIAQQIDQDREVLLEIMQVLGVRVDHLKVLGGWTAEKAGRLKLNGRLLSYSPLSRVVELEALTLGVHGKLGLWRSLEQHRKSDERLADLEIRALIRRAELQLEVLEAQRLKATAEAFGSERHPGD